MNILPNCEIIAGDSLEKLKGMTAQSVHCVVTSPPYYGLRDYNLPPTQWADGWLGCLGLEPTPQSFIIHCVELFTEVYRVLRDDGTAWVNMGDSYAQNRGGSIPPAETLAGGINGKGDARSNRGRSKEYNPTRNAKMIGFKHKDLMGMPWRLAFALQESGWYLRSDIIWHKPNPMPESVTDRPTKSHEYIFLLSKSERYYYDAEAIKEPVSFGTHARLSQNVEAQIRSHRANGGNKTNGTMKAVSRKSWKGSEFHTNKTAEHQLGRSQKNRKYGEAGLGIKNNENFSNAICLQVEYRNKRSVWTVATQPYREAHFATFPADLIKPCILAGCPIGGTILDPFGGSGTTGAVALELGRNAILIELNPDYVNLICARLHMMTPGMF